MGHDIYLKNCPRPVSGNCKSGASCSDEHITHDESYISFNFTKYKEYWHVSQGHGHSGRVVAIQLRNVIQRLSDACIDASIPDGGDGWTSTIEVFHYHIKRLLTFVEQYPDTTFLSDQIWDFIDDDNDTDDNNSDDSDYGDDSDKENIHPIGEKGSYVKSIDGNPRFGTLVVNFDDDKDEIISKALNRHPSEPKSEIKQEPVVQSIYTYFRHPIKGNMKIDTFAKASEVFTIMTLQGDPRARQWLELAQLMSDAPK